MTSKIKVNILADGGDNSIITSDGAGSFTASSSLASSVQSVGGIQMTPAFRARNNADQSISANTWTKLSYNTENLDTDGCYDTSNSRFTPTVAGYYFIFVTTSLNGGTDFDDANIAFYFNGGRDQIATFRNSYYNSKMLSGVFNFNGSTDYIESYMFLPQSFNTYNTNKPTFGGYRIIGT
jgi:hypothetical protein